MPTTDPVIVPIQGKDTLTPTIKKATMSLREMGEKVSGIGVRISAAFTLPIVGAFRAAVASSKELQAALVPIQDAFKGVFTELGTALIPVVKELAPTLISLANSLVSIIKLFEGLPLGQQHAILGFIAFLATIGPILVIGGQLINMIGTINMLLPGLASGLGTVSVASIAAAAPVIALVAAVGALIYLINSGTAAKAWNTLQQLVGIGLLKTGVINEQQFIAGSQNAGLFAAPAGAGATGATVFNYQPTMSTADKDEAARFVASVMPQVNRQLGR